MPWEGVPPSGRNSRTGGPAQRHPIMSPQHCPVCREPGGEMSLVGPAMTVGADRCGCGAFAPV